MGPETAVAAMDFGRGKTADTTCASENTLGDVRNGMEPGIVERVRWPPVGKSRLALDAAFVPTGEMAPRDTRPSTGRRAMARERGDRPLSDGIHAVQ